MTRRQVLPLVTGLGLLLAIADGAAQSSAVPSYASSAHPGAIETPHLWITIGGAPSIARNVRVTLTAEIVPKPNIHVYAPEQKQYLPVSLRLDRAPQLVARPAIFPKGEPVFFAPTRETQIVYSRPFRIELPITVGSSHPTGPLTLTGTLEYQACDDRVCYVPKKVPVKWMVKIQ